MKVSILQYSNSLTIEKTIMIRFNQHSKLANPRYDFGNKQVHNHRHLR